MLKDGECKEVVVAPKAYVPVDKTFTGKNAQRECEELGREWVARGNGGDIGCSTVTCKLDKDGAPRANNGKPYCVNAQYDTAYAVTMTKKACTDLKRVYVDQVGMCAQVANRKDKDRTVVKAPQCENAGYTYYLYKAKTDECFSPGYFQKAKGVAKVTKGSIGSILQVGPKTFCLRNVNNSWTNGHCVYHAPPSVGDCHGQGVTLIAATKSRAAHCSTECWNGGNYFKKDGDCVLVTPSNTGASKPETIDRPCSIRGGAGCKEYGECPRGYTASSASKCQITVTINRSTCLSAASFWNSHESDCIAFCMKDFGKVAMDAVKNGYLTTSCSSYKNAKPSWGSQ